MLAPSCAARLAMASPMPRLAPEMNMVLPERDMGTPYAGSSAQQTRGTTRLRRSAVPHASDKGQPSTRGAPVGRGVPHLLAVAAPEQDPRAQHAFALDHHLAELLEH